MAAANPQSLPTMQMNYWIRLAVGSECYLKKAVRCVLHNTFQDPAYTGLPDDPSNLFKELKKHQSALSQLKTNKRITSAQWKLLYPTNKLTCSKEFDIPLMVILLEHCTNLKPPVNGWRDSNPSLSDQGLAANSLRARCIRHFLYHYGNPTDMTKTEFSTKWNDLDDILKRLGYKVNTLDIKTGPLDPHRISYFKSVTTYLEEGHKKLLGLHEGAAADVAILKNQVFEMRNRVESIADLEKEVINIISDYTTLRTKIEENRQMIETHGVKIEQHDVKIEQHDVKIQQNKNDTAEVKDHIAELAKDLTAQLNSMKVESETTCKRFRWNIHETIPDFHGRVAVLDEVHNLLTHGSKKLAYSAVAISGLGGVGKTEVAAKYVELHDEEFENIIWLECNDLITSLARLASVMDIRTHVFEIDVLTHKICDKLNGTKSLFILNDTVNHESIRDFLKNLKPLQVRPHVIITTQYGQWDGSIIKQVPLTVFTDEEAVEFIMTSLTKTNVEHVSILVQELQALPLALQQAKSYIKKHSLNLEKYIQYFKQSRQEILDVRLDKIAGTDYDKTLLTVWKMAYDKLVKHKNSVAIEVLNMMTYMDGRCINANTFLYLEEMDDLILNNVIELLSEYSLIQVNNTKMITIHNLVQKVVQSYNKKMFDEKKLNKLLMKIVKSKTEKIDSDSENLWFIHVKKILTSGNIDDILSYDVPHVMSTAFFSGHSSFVLYISQIMIEITSMAYAQSGVGFENMIQHCVTHAMTLCMDAYYATALDFMDGISKKFQNQLQSHENTIIFSFKLCHVDVLLLNGNVKKAKKLFNTVPEPSSSCESYIEDMMFRSRILFDLERKSESRQAMNKALVGFSIEFKTISISYEICTLLLKLKDVERGTVFLEKLEVLTVRHFEPNSLVWSNLHLMKAERYEIKRQYGKSLEELTQCLNVSNGERFTLSCTLKICCVYFKMGEFETNKLILSDLLKQKFGENWSHLLVDCKCYLVATLLRLNDIETAEKILMGMKNCHSKFSASCAELIDKFIILKKSLDSCRSEYGDKDKKTIELLHECVKLKNVLKHSYKDLPIWDDDVIY